MNSDGAPVELRHPSPASNWKRTAFVVAAAIGVGVAMRWVLAPTPYPLGVSVPGWIPLKHKLLPVIMRLLVSNAPWIAAACIAAAKMPRRKWLWAIGCAIGAAIVYHVSLGVVLHIALPPMPDPDAPMTRLSIIADILAEDGKFTPPWGILLMVAAFEIPFALVGGAGGAALVPAGMKLWNARRTTQIAVGVSIAAVLVSVIGILMWIDRPPRRAEDADPGPIIEMRFMHDPPRRQEGVLISISPEPKYKRVHTRLDPSETVKMRVPDWRGSPGTEVLVHDVPALIISGTDILGAEAGFSGGYCVRVILTADGSRKVKDFTRRNLGRKIAIILEGRLMMTPIIMDVIISGSIVLYAGREEKDAVALAARINGVKPQTLDHR